MTPYGLEGVVGAPSWNFNSPSDNLAVRLSWNLSPTLLSGAEIGRTFKLLGGIDNEDK